MRFVEEIVVDEFLPTFRSLLAEELHERDLTQREVADLLGISQSAVSKYVHGEVDRNARLLENARLGAHVQEVAAGLESEELTPVQALVETEVLIRDLERGGVLADLHAEAVPALAEFEGALDVHDPDSRLRAAERTRSSVRRGLRVLENTGGFAGLIPAVGSNLVECLPEAERIEDVAGVPGRLLDVKGRVEVPAEPEFGVSGHVASLLLAARDSGAAVRAALNLRYDESIVADLGAAGHTTVEFDAEADLETAIADALAREPEATVLFQTGGLGIEPIVYVLGPDAPAVAESVRELV